MTHSRAIHLVLVRHGKTTADSGRCIGSTDVPLCAEGVAAIRELATSWYSAGSRSLISEPSRVIASDLLRATDSARVFAQLWDRAVEVDARLRELDFGEWDGKLWSDIEALDGKRLRAWMDRWADAVPPGGESLDQLVGRARSWIGDVRAWSATELPTTAPPTVLAIAHAGWIRVTIMILLGGSLDRMFDIPVDHAHATVVRVTSEGSTIVALNVPVMP